MQSAPLAGTATLPRSPSYQLLEDAIRTPRGDGNSIVRSTGTASFMMQSAPLAGTATRRRSPAWHLPRRYNPHPSRGRQLEKIQNIFSLNIMMQSADTVAPADSQTLRVCQSGFFLESGSLLPPPAALRLFPLAGTATTTRSRLRRWHTDAIRTSSNICTA